MAETHLQLHQPSGVTDSADFFVVSHYGAPPEAAVEHGRIRVRDAHVDATVQLDDVKSLPGRDVTAVLECAGMSRGMLRHKAPGAQFGHGLCGLGTWTGTPLTELLRLAGAAESFATLTVHGLDCGWMEPENKYARFGKGLPLDKALHQDTIVAWQMNGVDLPHEHGGPLRLVVPGWAGVWWVKWIQEIATGDQPFGGFWQHERYRYRGGDFESPEVVTTLPPRSIITNPAESDVVPVGSVEVRGKAWSGDRRVATVEVSGDGGHSWCQAELSPATSPWGWVEFSATVQVEGPGATVLCARATDDHGDSQDWDSRRNDLGYGNNDIMCVPVRTRHE